jgi:hypothetical protein
MGLHAKVPCITFLGLVHLRVSALLLVLGRRWRLDDGGIDNRAFLHHQPPLAQHDADLVEQLSRQFMLDEHTAKFQQRSRVRHRFDRQVDPGERAHRHAVVQRVFQRLVRQPVPLLQEVDAQHPLQSDRRSPTMPLGVVRLDRRYQALPGHHAFHLRQEALATSHALLAVAFRFRKTDLSLHLQLISLACT